MLFKQSQDASTKTGSTHCSPNVRHLEIDTNFPSYKTTGSATLQLESLRLGLSMGILEHVHPLHYSDFYPFDLSKLKALSIYLQLPVCWNDLIRCETIKVLELYGGRRAQDQDITKRLDISTFTSLTTLRIITSQTVSADIIDACASIVTSQPIRSISIALDGIVFGSQIAGYRKLDSTLSSLPLLSYPDIEFAVRVSTCPTGFPACHLAIGCSDLCVRTTFTVGRYNAYDNGGG
ncbi:hypothetical protein R3P38DRAFT_3374024 [Favolaschia claudopus]|uniref:Uncharacterized protein n=1 Tax=Favolaschia claudopus TaxID=2862362 RepID=A0AAV9ZQZ7_9AGAR